MSEWITDRLPTESECDDGGDVLIPYEDGRSINWGPASDIELGDPWLPAPPIYIEPKTRDELVQDLIASIDKHGACGAIQEAREKLK